MKIKFLLLIILMCVCFNTQAQESKISKTLNEISQLVNQVNTAINGSLVDLGSATIEINSTSKAYFGGGHTRGLFQVHLPRGTQQWYYRITVLDIKSNYLYQTNESLFYLLNNRLPDNSYRPTTDGVDFFLLGTSGDANSFSQTGNNNFSYINGYGYLNTNSFFEGSTIVQDNLWIGVRNNNKVEGLKVIIEVVAYGHFY